MAEKLVLVPEAILKSKERSHQQPIEKKISGLDKEIENILQRDIPDDEKVKRYYQALDQYLEYYKQQQIKKPVPVQLASHSTEPQQVGQHTDILQDLPQSSREKAGRLLRHLQRSPGFKWDSNSRLILDVTLSKGQT